MTDDPIHRLLTDADTRAGGAPALPDPATVAARARHAVRRRRRARRAAAAALIIVVGGAAWVSRLDSGGPPAPPTLAERPAAPDTGAIRATLAALDDEAAWRQVLAERLAAAERPNRAPRAIAPAGDPLGAIDHHVERAAWAMVLQADRMARDLGLPRPAEDAYRDVTEDFPDTTAAAAARERLAALDLSSGKDG